jgi:hypothetical protein
MNAITTVTQGQLSEFLLNVAVVRPVFIWGPPGIGKSSLVQQFAAQVGLRCVSLLGSQLAPEDLIGVPQIVGDVSRFCPPAMIARREPYCLFLDELNACSHEVQKAFYSLIHERRVGEYELPAGSIVIGAGNRAQDSAIVKPMSSALLNRMVHVHLKVSPRDWLEWARRSGVHPLVLDYVQNRPDHLWSQPPKHEEPFSTPRSWHILSDALNGWGEKVPDDRLDVLAHGCLTPHHAGQFKAFVKHLRSQYRLGAILKGEAGWPAEPENRDILYFLVQSFRARLIKELPADSHGLSASQRELAHRAKGLLKELAALSLEMAQLVVAKPNEAEALPAGSWWKSCVTCRGSWRSAMPTRRKRAGAGDPATENFLRACGTLRAHPLFAPLMTHAQIIREERNLCPPAGWAVVTTNGYLHVHPKRRGEPAEWVYVLAHCLLHLGFGHLRERPRPREWNAACDCFLARFLGDLKLGRPPEELQISTDFPARTEERLYECFCEHGIPEQWRAAGTAGPGQPDLIFAAKR